MKKKILTFLKEKPLGTLITLSSENRSHATPVYVYVDDLFSCYCITKEATRKCDNIQKEKKVTLSFFDEDSLTTCQVIGDAYIAQSGEDVIAALTRLQEIFHGRREGYWIPPVSQLKATQYAIIKVVPSSIEYWRYGDVAEVKPEHHSFKL